MTKSIKAQGHNIAQSSYDLIYTDPARQDPIQTAQEMLREIEDGVWKCADAGREKYKNRDFYIEVNFKKEPLYPNFLRPLFAARRTCSTPWYDQWVMKYHHKVDEIEELWVIPDYETCQIYKYGVADIPKAEEHLMQYILDFDCGAKNNKLELKAKRYNNEKIDAPSIVLVQS